MYKLCIALLCIALLCIALRDLVLHFFALHFVAFYMHFHAFYMHGFISPHCPVPTHKRPWKSCICQPLSSGSLRGVHTACNSSMLDRWWMFLLCRALCCVTHRHWTIHQHCGQTRFRNGWRNGNRPHLATGHLCMPRHCLSWARHWPRRGIEAWQSLAKWRLKASASEHVRVRSVALGRSANCSLGRHAPSLPLQCTNGTPSVKEASGHGKNYVLYPNTTRHSNTRSRH